MAIIPTVRCQDIAASLAFYTKVLDFTCTEATGTDDPAVAFLARGGDLLWLSSFPGDGVLGQAVVVITQDVDGLFEKFLKCGLVPPERDSPVHQGPLNQTWGTREFYVDDPDGNTLRFVEASGV